jgi:multidrug efflux pump subunit AcrA (membrane-fusion protein)
VKKPRRSSRLSRPKRLPLPRRPLEWGLAIVAVALIAIAITSLGTGSSSSSAASKRTSTAGKGVVQSTVSGNGTLEPAQKVELSFGASGEVTAIYAKAGDTVKKGEVLAEVDSSSARASLASAEAQLIEAEEAVETAEEAEEEEAEEEENEETAYEGGAARTVFVGLMSKEGTAAAKVETEAAGEGPAKEGSEEDGEATAPSGTEKTASGKAKEEASAQPEGGSATKESSGTEAEAEAPAAKESAAPSSAATGAAEATTGAAEATTGAAEATTGSTASGGASVSLPTAEANLREAQLSVKSARQEVRETTLRAPIAGTIASVSGAIGETVSGGSSSGGTSEASTLAATGGESTSTSSSSAFMVLAQLHRLKMEVSFSESDIGKVREGQTATVAIDSLEGTELAGEVTKVSVLPSEGSSSVVEYPATILLTQSAKGLRAGMSASAEVVVEQVKNAVTVPSEAISQAGGGKTVTVEEDGKEVTKTVTTGLVGDETTEVVSGLKAGATVILPEVSVATATEGSTGGGEEEARGFPSSGSGAGGFTPPTGGGFPGGAP